MSESAVGSPTPVVPSTQALIADAAAAAEAAGGSPLKQVTGDLPQVADLEEETVKVSVDLPLAITVSEDPTKPWILGIEKPNCLRCDVLVEDGELDGSSAKCHYRLGNANCPAAQIRIVNYGARNRAARILREAAANAQDNPLGIAKAMSKVSAMVEKGELSQSAFSWAMKEAGIL